METKISFFGGTGDSDKVSPKLDIYLLFLLFQGAEESDGQAGGATEAVSVGRKLRPKEDCLGELGYSLSAKEERGLGYKGFGEV